MIDTSHIHSQILLVDQFQDLISTPFVGDINAICWNRKLVGDFQEIVAQVDMSENIVVIDEDDLRAYRLSEAGQLAREILLKDIHLLTAHGADPVLNVIKCYDRDDDLTFFPTDVYSYHVDRSPVPTDTFLCTYVGAASEILPNAQAMQKVLVPEIRTALKEIYSGNEDEFENYLIENFYDLHYLALPDAKPINLGQGHMWRLAIDHPDSLVLPCVHRAPLEKNGECRLLLIC
jgi:Protein of unknown function (DUF1826)